MKSANQGYADAQLELGYLYYYGDVIKQDKDKASELFKKACLNGIEDYDELCAEWR
nr:SEL1-like repeat protein [Providencia rettgeri]